LDTSSSTVEKRKRINAARWAYAYAVMDDPIVPDGVFDSVCREIRPEVSNDNPLLD
jgi:hypothetical protein